MGFGAVLSLWWARALVRALGPELYGTFSTFLDVAQLGGLGDLGISGAVGIRMLQHLARNEDEAGRRFLANARGAFIVLALGSAAAFVALSPWLPDWLGFKPPPGAGSVHILFVLGGIGAGLVIINGYFQNLNSIHRNLVWPVLPAFVLVQAGFLGQWLVARAAGPLWAQFSVYIGCNLAGLWLGAWMLKATHPWLGNLRPIRFDWAELRDLVSTSAFVYLCALGNWVYVSTDRILVNAGFGPGQVPAYRFNYKLCEFAVLLLSSASYVAMPAITARLLNRAPAENAFGLAGLERLQRLQALAACGLAILYLAFNDVFIRLWQGRAFNVSLSLQLAFALNLAITIAGDAALQVRGRLDTAGVRLAGITVAFSALLNLGLSLCAMKARYLAGIAAATVVAQSVLSFVMSRSTCALLKLSLKSWLLRTWCVPIVSVTAFAVLRHQVRPDTVSHVALLAAAAAGFMAVLAYILGVRWQFAVDEWKRLRASIR